MRYRIEFDLPDNETVLERISTVNVQWCVGGYSGTAHVKPAIEPERKKGKWIFKDDLKQYFCSECGYPSLTYDDVYIYGMDLPNFCEECGADMRGEQNE